jgi:UPF0755 protein
VSVARRLARLVLLVVLLLGVTALWLINRLHHPGVGAGPTDIVLYIPPGTSTDSIFRRLAGEGVVGDARLAEIYYRLHLGATPLQAGEYRFRRPMDIDDVIGRMRRGDVLQHTIIVPDGLTAEETFRLFLDRGIGTPDAFRAALAETDLLPGLAQGAPDLEGFLFPESYQVTRSTTARQVVGGMVGQFRRNFGPELRDRARALGLSLREAVTLASIVQKETGLSREASTVAGFYWNRLTRGMRLQADPTVAYALKRDGKWTGVLHRSDYNFESPYNTYLYEGLPPGPICNPGMASLAAAVEPARTDFLYFVADANGGHTFSRTFEQHLQAIATSRRLRAEGTSAPPVEATPASRPSGDR